MREAHLRRLYTVGLDDTLQLYDTLQNPKLQGTEKEEQLVPRSWDAERREQWSTGDC